MGAYGEARDGVLFRSAHPTALPNERLIVLTKRKIIRREGRGVFARVVVVALLAVSFLSPAAISEEAPRGPENAAPVDGGAAGKAETAEREMKIGHYHLSKKAYTAAINRFKVVVSRFPSSPVADEALFRLMQAYFVARDS
jgi:TolA-binding protein